MLHPVLQRILPLRDPADARIGAMSAHLKARLSRDLRDNYTERLERPGFGGGSNS